MSDAVEVVAQNIGISSASSRRKTTGLGGVAEQEVKKRRGGPTTDRGRRRRRRTGRGRGATVLTTGQELGIANIALKRLTGA